MRGRGAFLLDVREPGAHGPGDLGVGEGRGGDDFGEQVECPAQMPLRDLEGDAECPFAHPGAHPDAMPLQQFTEFALVVGQRAFVEKPGHQPGDAFLVPGFGAQRQRQ